MKLTYDDFKDYLSKVNKLYALTRNLIEYYDNVVEQANEKNVHELPKSLRNIIISGLKPDGEYSKNAYALFIKDFIGLYIDDPKLYTSKLRLGVKPNAKIVTKETKFMKFVRLLNKVSKFILNRTRELNLISNIDTSTEESETKQQSIEELITKLIETSYALSVGVNTFSTSICGLRKITPHYMKKAYENLSEDFLRTLGFSRLVSIREYEIWGFPDYFTICTVHENYYLFINGVVSDSEWIPENLWMTDIIRPKTLGGAICILNETIWRYINLLYDILSKGYKGIINIEEKYVEKAWKSLDDIGWNMPEYMKIGIYERLYSDFRDVLRGRIGSSYGSSFKFLIPDDDGIIKEYIQWVYRGSHSGFNTYSLSRYILLPELFDDLLPAIFLGVIDVTLYFNNQRALLILVRGDKR